MPHLDRTGPEGKGKQTGRGIGQCRTISDNEVIEKMGKGLGLRRKSGGGLGQGNRLKSGLK
jgi:hypothetical protein